MKSLERRACRELLVLKCKNYISSKSYSHYRQLVMNRDPDFETGTRGQESAARPLPEVVLRLLTRHRDECVRYRTPADHLGVVCLVRPRLAGRRQSAAIAAVLLPVG
jgi:hypothetical protein